MPNCPQCSKPLREFSRRCPSCQADLDLLVDYVTHLQGGLDRADSLTRSGELGKAFWAYLEVLETDPDNQSARRQIGQVVNAVRQFDRVAPGRRWLNGTGDVSQLQPWLLLGLASLLILLAFTFGYVLGYSNQNGTAAKDGGNPPPSKPLDPLDKLHKNQLGPGRDP